MASAAAGRALRAAQPQTEFTTTSVGARSLASTASTSSAVRSSSKPRRVRSSRIGRTISGSYIGTFRFRILSSLLEKRAQSGAKVRGAAAHGVDIGAEPQAVGERAALDEGDERLGQPAHPHEHLRKMQRRLAVLLERVVGGGEQLLQI